MTDDPNTIEGRGRKALIEGLSKFERRRLERLLEKLQKKYGLAEDNHLRWPYSPERRQAVREQRIEKRDADFYNTFGSQFSLRNTDIPIYATRAVRPGDPNSTSWQHYVQIVRGMPESRDELGKFLAEMDPLAALQADPGTGDPIGGEETENYLMESFDAIAEVHFPGGSKESKPYEDFIALLGELELRAIEGCLALWPGRSDWVQRVVVPAVGDRLKRAAETWRVRARGSAEKDASPDSSTAPVMESPTADDLFDSHEKREGAIEMAAVEYDTRQAVGASDLREQRRALRDQYKRECKAGGVKVTDEMIAKAANKNWNDRTLVVKWASNDPQSKPEHDKMIRAVFKNKPHKPHLPPK